MLRPLDDTGFVWASLDDVSAAQQRHKGAIAPATMTQEEHDVWMLDGKIWIPPSERELIQRICTIAHYGARGHRGQAAMINDIQASFSTSLPHISNGAYSVNMSRGHIVRRPWSEPFRCEKRNGALHWDFLFLGESFGSSKYLLVMKDDATHYCELTVCDGPTSAVAVAAMLDWYSRFGAPHTWISDNGSHFTSEVITDLCKHLKSQQSFTVAYSPWINGSVERLNRDVIAVLRALLLEYKLHARDWPSLIPIVQASLNHTALPSLGNHAPVELFTGLPRSAPLLDAFVPTRAKPLVPADPLKIASAVDGLRQAIVNMHRDTLPAREKQTHLNRRKEMGESVVNFSVGDYVLRSRVDEKHKNKLLVTWTGPYAVVSAEKNAFRIRSLVNGKEFTVDASRLKFFADSELNVTAELIQHASSQGTVLDVRELRSHRWNSKTKDYDLLVAWVGLEDLEDSWEPLQAIAKDIREITERHVQASGDRSPLSPPHFS